MYIYGGSGGAPSAKVATSEAAAAAEASTWGISRAMSSSYHYYH